MPLSVGNLEFATTGSCRVEKREPVADLSHAIWIPFISPWELTVERVLEGVASALQSAKEWLLEGAMEVVSCC